LNCIAGFEYNAAPAYSGFDPMGGFGADLGGAQGGGFLAGGGFLTGGGEAESKLADKKKVSIQNSK
jgi:hypothetical protein